MSLLDVQTLVSGMYYDTALSAAPTAMNSVLAATSRDHIVFGSDWPFTPELGVARNLHQLTTAAELSESDLRAIARENAERVFPRLLGKSHDAGPFIATKR